MKIKLDLIQFLRGMMAIIVVLHHISGAMFFYLNKNWVYDIFSVGWFGVDFFFVLSGFIMVYAHKEDYILRTNVAKFFKKRFTRIYPTYWIIA
jgi:exopolysaccharide production protein ExoZ